MKNYYNQQEKELLINFFITEGMNSKKDFKGYLESFVQKHGKRVNEKFKSNRSEGVWSELLDYEIENVQYFWGNENNDNLVTYLFSQPKFLLSGSKIKNIEKLKIDFNHVTHSGENILFYTRMSDVKETKDLIKKHKIDTTLVNIHGDIFFSRIFDNYYSNSKNMSQCFLEEIRLENVMNLIAEYHDLMYNLDEKKIKDIQIKFHKCIDSMESKLYEITSKEKNIHSLYEEDKEKGNLPYQEHRMFMNRIFDFHILNKKLINDNKVQIKKVKI